MSDVLKTVGKVAGIVASIAMFIPGGQPIAAIAAGISAVASIGAEITAKKPAARGSVTSTIIATNPPSPYIIGRTYAGGVIRHRVGYGGTVGGVVNPYLTNVVTYSVGGPIDAIESRQIDFADVAFSGTEATGYFAGFLWASTQLGATPEAAALAGPFGAIPDWGAAYKLSGKPSVLWTLKFDRDGHVYASGEPQQGVIARGVLCYDPRKDSTYPGGAGSHRWADPADTAAFHAVRETWEYSACPGLHALKYALGSYERDPETEGSVYRKVFGIGMPIDGVIVGDFVALANVCDANGWTCGGVIFEPGDRWANLKAILQAGGAVPAFAGSLLGLKISAPRVSLDTITRDDLADGEVDIIAMQSWRDRLNTIVPKCVIEDQKWQLLPIDAAVVPDYVDEDGEEKIDTIEYPLVQAPTQATQLAYYKLFDGRELVINDLACKPRLRRYRPGQMLTVDLPEEGLIEQPCLIVSKRFDPARMVTIFGLVSETEAKHALALAATGEAPPTPALLSTADRDGASASASLPPGYLSTALRQALLLNDGLPVVHGEDAGDGTATVTIDANTWDYPEPIPNVTRAAGTITGLTLGETVFIYFDDPTLADTAPAYFATTSFDESRSATTDFPYRHALGGVILPSSGGGPVDGGGGGGGGGGGPIP